MINNNNIPLLSQGCKHDVFSWTYFVIQNVHTFIISAPAVYL